MSEKKVIHRLGSLTAMGTGIAVCGAREGFYSPWAYNDDVTCPACLLLMEGRR